MSKKHYKQNNAYPDYNFQRVEDITPEDIRKMGAKAVAVDLDDTTVKDASFHLPRSSRAWAKDMQDAGIPVIIVTNTYPIRAYILSIKMGRVPYISFARKPHSRPIRKAAEKLGLKPEEIAMIGDTLFKDMLAANRAGAISVKVEPRRRRKQ